MWGGRFIDSDTMPMALSFRGMKGHPGHTGLSDLVLGLTALKRMNSLVASKMLKFFFGDDFMQ